MILEFEKIVNPNLLLGELRVIDSRINITVHGKRIEVIAPNDLSEGQLNQIETVVEDHEFIDEDEKQEHEEHQLKDDFENATTIAQIKTVLKKKFRW